MPPSKKRKLATEAEVTPEMLPAVEDSVVEETRRNSEPPTATYESPPEPTELAPVDKATERRERFKALQTRAVCSDILF